LVAAQLLDLSPVEAYDSWHGEGHLVIKVLKEALDEVGSLPESDQERIGQELLEYARKLRALRADIQAGIDSLDRGEGREFDMDDVVRRARARHAQRSKQ
jgi:hypothetical protein